MKRSDQLNELYVGRNLRALTSQDGVKMGFVYLILAVLAQDEEATTFELKNVISGNTYTSELPRRRYEVFGLSQADRDILLPKIVEATDKEPTHVHGTRTDNAYEDLNSTDLRKYASTIGIKNSSSYTKEELQSLCAERLAELGEDSEESPNDTPEETYSEEESTSNTLDVTVHIKEQEEGAAVQIEGNISEATAKLLQVAIGLVMQADHNVNQAILQSKTKALAGILADVETS